MTRITKVDIIKYEIYNIKYKIVRLLMKCKDEESK